LVRDFNKFCRVVVELKNAKRDLFVSRFEKTRKRNETEHNVVKVVLT
jgi:hypothetical protein